MANIVLPDSGEIWFDGQRRPFNTPLDARRVGIETVYQNLALADHLDVAANLFLTMHFDPVALCAFSEIDYKLPSISIIPENLFPSISTRHDVVDGTGKLNPRRS